MAPLWRAVAAFRVAALAYAAASIVHGHSHYAHPYGGWAALAAMVLWTGLMVVRRPGRLLVVVDVAVAAGLVLATRWVETAARIADGAPTLPVAWAAAPVLAAAVGGGPFAGLAAAVAVGAADIGERGEMAQSTFNSIALLLIAGLVAGYASRLWVRANDAVARAAGLEAATAERERLARDIHDSVLQVLALVQRRGAELGGESAELGRLAGEQERALRALVAAPVPTPREGGLVDVREALASKAAGAATFAAPADPVLVPVEAAQAVTDAVAEALTNVRRHAGAQAKAWLLIEDEPTAVTVTVRDDGCGFARGRLEEAAAAGRLGVAQSIRGRVSALGGSATLTSEPGRGTEVEIRVPR